MSARLTLWLLVLAGAAAGCSSQGGALLQQRGPALAEVIAELPDVALPEATAAKPSRQEVMAAYERVYGLVPDAVQNQAVGKRLADLRMSVGQDLDLSGAEHPYGDAVALYESLLDSAATEGRDEILYQLARAHDLQGDTDAAVGYLDRLLRDYPDSTFVAEARFRRAEIAFTREQYRDAARDYGYVVSLGDASPYWQTASYMRGWSLFKVSELDDSLASFFAVIHSLLGEAVPGVAVEDTVAGLPTTNRELLEDTFRVVDLALNYLDGAATLAAQMDRLGKPGWQYLAYQRLADDHLNKERYLDSVATWQTFIERNSLDPRAPQAHIGMIRTLTQADFPSEIRPKQEAFVERYGIHSQFWSVHEQSVIDSYRPTLKKYLTELAGVDHAAAQTAVAAATAGTAQYPPRQRHADFMKAAAWYEQLILTFPDDAQTANTLFLLGEVYTEAGEHRQAVAAYQRVVREYGAFERAPEAGYAAILGLSELVAAAPSAERELWQRLEIDAQIEFALMFPGDARAASAQGGAADTLFALAQYEEAVQLAGNLLITWPEADAELRRTALLIVGHGHFELADFVAAESAYRQLLRLPLTADDSARVSERLLAAVYKQAEASEQTGAVDEAVAHYLRLQELDTNAELAIQGHYDAVAVLEGAERVPEAAALLDQFRARYPDHPLGRDTEKRLAGMYEHTQDWASAAAEYVRLAANADDADVRRQSLYRAAELYLELDSLQLAVDLFRDYANTYKRPLDLRLEAMHHLDGLYQQLDEPAKRRHWLAAKIELHKEMGRQATERATYLAAQASYVLAEDERVLFDAIRLTHPLAASLKRKQKALKSTVKAFEAVAGYEVADFATAATFQIADLYAALSQAIMQSDRPTDLSELELAQYEILLEEQAYPFEEQAIGLHEINMRRSWDGVYDDWVKRSFVALSRLMPARFDKQEVEVAYVEAIY